MAGRRWGGAGRKLTKWWEDPRNNFVDVNDIRQRSHRRSVQIVVTPMPYDSRDRVQMRWR
jgi:hypothetical protein